MDLRSEFGEELRKQRLAKEVSLDEISRATKIRKTFLESIEAGRFEALPSSEVVILGFLRTYARQIHIDEQILAAKYRQAVGAPAELQKAPYLALPSERRWHLWPLLLGILLLAGGWGTFWLMQRRGMAPHASMAAASGSGKSAAEDRSPAQPPVPVEGPSLAAPSLPKAGGEIGFEAQETSLPQPEAPGPLQLPVSAPPAVQEPKDKRASQGSGDLVIETTEPCWMEIWQGNTRLIFRLVETGERISLNGLTFSVTLGNRNAATVHWKGSLVAPPSGDGMVVSRWKIPPSPDDEVMEP